MAWLLLGVARSMSDLAILAVVALVIVIVVGWFVIDTLLAILGSKDPDG